MTKQQRTVVAIVVVMVISASFGAGMLGGWLGGRVGQRATRTAQSTQVSETDSTPAPVTQEEADITEVAKRVSPSVVSVLTSQIDPDDPFSLAEASGAGTGVVISGDGYIMTNKHVVRGARSVAIVTSAGVKHDAVKIVGSDPLNDIAFLKVDGADGLVAATLGDSGTVRVGQRAIAIGNSLGQFQNTVTTGIISGKGRPIAASDGHSRAELLHDLLQTDAAINPGNSGGPLLDTAGRVIGINTAIVSGSQSIGFAIPINATKGLIRGVVAGQGIQKASLGVRHIDITPEVQRAYKLSQSRGAYIPQLRQGSAVLPDSAAAKAGVQPGDIITKVNDKVVSEHGGLGSLVSEFVPGDTVTLTIVRGQDTKQLSVSLGAYQA